MTRARMRRAVALLAAAGLAAGCADQAPVTHDGPPSPPPPVAAAGAIVEPGALATVQAAPAEIQPPAGRAPFEVARRTAEQAGGQARRFGAITMPIALRTRTPDLSQYPCTSCHLGMRVVMAERRVADAHQNIRPVHPEATGARCSTCHAADDVERLVVQSGERPSLDHAYRLCAQCHAPQVSAWAGGGHGKRLDGWLGRRVVMNCADCHDPHAPSLEPRIPFRAPRLDTRGGHE